MSNWDELVQTEPRLQQLCDAATATARRLGSTLTNHDVYGMVKPYIAQLVGWRRGQYVNARQPAPDGSPLADYCRAANDLAIEASRQLAGNLPYETAVSRISSEIYSAWLEGQRRAA